MAVLVKVDPADFPDVEPGEKITLSAEGIMDEDGRVRLESVEGNELEIEQDDEDTPESKKGYDKKKKESKDEDEEDDDDEDIDVAEEITLSPEEEKSRRAGIRGGDFMSGIQL